MKRAVDLSLYFITDRALCAGRGLVETAIAAARGGATLIQLRDPGASAAEMIGQARALLEALRPFDVPLVINDRADIARAVGAAGVHIGQADLPPAATRDIVGPDAIVGLSITDPAQMARTPWDLIDHLGVGPVFGKGVKADAAEPMGLAGLAACAGASRRPIVAIGGIDLSNAASCIRAGAHGVAVVSAIAAAPEPETAALALRRAVDAARSGAREAAL